MYWVAQSLKGYRPCGFKARGLQTPLPLLNRIDAVAQKRTMGFSLPASLG
jgi:hypothetical protein